MNIDRLMQRIRLGEDSTLEMRQVLIRGGGKAIEPHPDGLSDELAALGNARGGTLILGVDNKTWEITGIPLVDDPQLANESRRIEDFARFADD